MDPAVQLIVEPEREPLSDFGTGRNELVLKCIEGPHRGIFFYVSTSPHGELFGSGSPEEFSTTVYLEAAGLSKSHALIKFTEDTCLYTLQDLDSETGTWLSVQEHSLPGEILAPGTWLRIGDFDFTVAQGEEVQLEDHWRPLVVAGDYKPPDCSLDEFLSTQVHSLQLTEDIKEQLAQSISTLRALPRTLKSFKFTSEVANFVVHYETVTIGASTECSVKLRGLSPVHVKIVYDSGWHQAVNLELHKHSVFRRLERDEELPLAPGHVIKMGDLLFEVSKFNVGRWGLCGKRECMEDEDVIVNNTFIFQELPVPLYGVYDGHGGSRCAEFLKEHLHQHLISKLKQNDRKSEDVIGVVTRTIVESIAAVDKAFVKTYHDLAMGMGSTALFSMLLGDRILTVNLGDSRAVLSRQGIAIDLSVDHKPSSPGERERVEELGALVAGNRIVKPGVDTQISISRSFGDFSYKLSSPVISIEPDITQAFIHPSEDEFLLLACDGFFDAYSSQEAVSLIRSKLLEMPLTKQDPNIVIREVINNAVCRNMTSDNVTAILVILRCGIK